MGAPATARTLKKIAIGLLVAFALFNLLGFFGVPLTLRYVMEHQVSRALSRPVTVGGASFNPYTLRLEVTQLHIGEHGGAESFVDLGRLIVDAAWASLFKLAPNIEELVLESPRVQIAREPSKRFNFSDLIPPPSPDKPKAGNSSFRFRVDSIAITGGTIAYADETGAKEIALRLSPLQLTVDDISQDLTKPWKLAASGALNGKGNFSLAGTVTLAPLNVLMKLNSRDLDVAVAEPYFSQQLNASIKSALLSANGEISLAGEGAAMKAGYAGDATLGDVKMLDKATGDLFAGWKTLNISQIKAGYEQGRTDVELGTITLNEFYARVILDKQGELNLSHVVKTQGAPQTKSLTRADETAAAPASKPATPEPAKEVTTASPFNLRFGQVALERGHVNYTDNFIKPNFTADLTDIDGKIGAFGNHSERPAPLELQGKLNGTDPVTMKGSLNPLVQPPFLDLAANARNVVLTNFAPYSTKYLGYPIVKGTLTVDVHYLLDKGRLTASNHIFIDQLTFGDHVDSPTATNLPVRLAISLLKDSHGRINIDLPVSGSLSDPQFSVGALVWHAFLNVIEKAITSPFTLLASAFGGGDELGYVEFAPGSSQLSQPSLDKLGKVAKALADRPSIQLQLTGRADPALDEPALRTAYVDRQIKRQKLKAEPGKHEDDDPDSVTIAPDEYEKYLTAAYKAGDFKKQRNLIGLTKTLPTDQMKALLLANIPAPELDLRQLAQRRAVAVQSWFDGKIASDRVHVSAPKTDSSGIKGKGPTTGVEFDLK